MRIYDFFVIARRFARIAEAIQKISTLSFFGSKVAKEPLFLRYLATLKYDNVYILSITSAKSSGFVGVVLDLKGLDLGLLDLHLGVDK